MIIKRYLVKNMKNALKILIGISILFLIMGCVAAFELNGLKTIEGYEDFDADGYSAYKTNIERYFCIQKIESDIDSNVSHYFENESGFNITFTPAGDNIFYTEDNEFNTYGYEEAVEIDGNNYTLSINQNTPLSSSEKELFLKDLQELNKANNLKPLEIK